MIEEAINELIIQMGNRGFEFTHTNQDGVHFDLTDGTNGFLCLADWEAVENFCDKYEVPDDDECDNEDEREFVDDWRNRSQHSPFNNDEDKEELFLEYCNRVESGELPCPKHNSAMSVVDNFYVNGDFYRRSEVEDDEEWADICRRAIVYNDKIACLKF